MRLRMLTLSLLVLSTILTANAQDLPVPAIAATEEAQFEPMPGEVLDSTTMSSCAVNPTALCDSTVGATCCDGTCETYRCCCCGFSCCYMPGIHKRHRNGKLKWCRVWTTGDMYPHYAYDPVNFGYYYFRPYNYINVEEHRELIVRLGGERNHPYSLALFDGIYEKHYQNHPARVQPTAADLIPDEEQLPDIEDLLN